MGIVEPRNHQGCPSTDPWANKSFSNLETAAEYIWRVELNVM
jgi:hypothetical protein